MGIVECDGKKFWFADLQVKPGIKILVTAWILMTLGVDLTLYGNTLHKELKSA